MKKIFLSFLLCAITALCSAQQTLILWYKNGEKMLFSLDDNIKTTFQSGDIIISSDALTVSYPLSEVQKYTFQDNSNGINKTVDDDLLIQMKEKGNVIEIHNLKKGAIVEVYTTDGKRIVYERATTAVTTIDFKEFVNGVYICKIGGVSYKFIKS